MFGIVQRGARGPHTVAYDFYPYLYGHGGGIFKDQAATELFGDAQRRKPPRSSCCIRLAREAGHPKTAAFDQAEVIQQMVAGQAGRIMMVIAAWSQMDDPAKSIVVDKVEFAPTPHVAGVPTSPGLATGSAACRRTCPTIANARRSSSSAGSRPRRRRSPAPSRRHPDQRRRLSRPDLAGASLPLDEADGRVAETRGQHLSVPEASEVIAILELGLNRAIAGEITWVAALNTMTDEIHSVMAKYHYRARARR